MGEVVDLSAPVLNLVDLADLHARDTHRRSGGEPTGIVEVDEDRELRLKAHLSHDQDECCQEPERDQDEKAHFDFDGALLHGSAHPRARLTSLTSPSGPRRARG